MVPGTTNATWGQHAGRAREYYRDGTRHTHHPARPSKRRVRGGLTLPSWRANCDHTLARGFYMHQTPPQTIGDTKLNDHEPQTRTRKAFRGPQNFKGTRN